MLRAVLAAAAGASVWAAPATAVAAAPPNPSDGQISQARNQARQRAVEAGRLAARLATKTGQMRRLADTAELAVERYDRARVDLGRAVDRVATARAGVRRARRQVDRARADLRRFARGSYLQGSMLGSMTALVAPGGPEDLIARLGYLDLASRRRLDVVGRLVRAQTHSANADSASRAALAAQRAAADTAARAKARAEHELVRSREQTARLGAQASATRRRLARDQNTLNAMLADRRQYLAWERAQQRARERARERARQRARQKAREAAADQAGAAIGSRPSVPPMPPDRPGGWTPALGRAVADAALHWLGTPYAWSGGNAEGPTEGSYPDQGVRGFDCSGLVLWAWGQVGVRLPHYSGYQYQSGQHVPRDALMPGDLVFWSVDGSPAGIHHVAIYLGGGRVVQAPHSGDVVRVSPMWSQGYVGATRPDT
ncbi:MAG TPA: NlpC/P60 family protein [Mycobacteriales bacterium]|nr:NlpC/P60 family protein [Mycobacteriales bacterium]